MIRYYLILYFSVLLAGAAQVLLKKGAGNNGNKTTLLERFVRPVVIAGLLMMVVSMVLNIYGLRYIPLKNMAFVLPAVYVVVPFFSWLFLKETVGRRTMAGSLIICLGVFVFNI